MIETIFFDRDGIINHVVPRGSTISSPRAFSEFAIRQEFSDFYKTIADLPLRLFVVSNQPDVQRALLSESDLNLMNELMLRTFRFTEIVYCKHDDRDSCRCRKPQPGMLMNLIDKYDLSREKALIVGDSWKDIAAGAAAKVKTAYLRTSYNKQMNCRPDIVLEQLPQLVEAGWLGVHS